MKCKRCDEDATPTRRLCRLCRRKWIDASTEAWQQAKSEVGLVTPENQEQVKKRTRQLKKQLLKDKSF